MPVFFRILYTSDMRVSELRLIKLKDKNPVKGCITVREAKNHKERVIPIHPLLTSRCIELREKLHAGSSGEEYFFMLRPGQAMPLVNVYRNFRRYLEKTGISHTGNGPRVHDFRHTYCVNLLRKWTDEGKGLMAYLPYMRVMLGHEGFEETTYYLKLTAERFPYIKERLKASFTVLIKVKSFMRAQINGQRIYSSVLRTSKDYLLNTRNVSLILGNQFWFKLSIVVPWHIRLELRILEKLFS